MFLSSTSHSSSLLHCFSHLNTWNKSSHPTCVLYSLSPSQCFQSIYSSCLSFSFSSPRPAPSICYFFFLPIETNIKTEAYNATVNKSTPSAPPTIVEKSHQLNIARLFSSDITLLILCSSSFWGKITYEI